MSYLIKDTAVLTARTLDKVFSFFFFHFIFCLSIFNLFHGDVCMYVCITGIVTMYYNNGGYIKRENIV
jgi:hypothetical protein